MISLHSVNNIRLKDVSGYGDTNWFTFYFDMEETVDLCFYVHKDSEAHHKLAAIASLLHDWKPPVEPLAEEDPVDAAPNPPE